MADPEFMQPRRRRRTLLDRDFDAWIEGEFRRATAARERLHVHARMSREAGWSAAEWEERVQRERRQDVKEIGALSKQPSAEKQLEAIVRLVWFSARKRGAR